MNVASLELCKELYELSGWGGTAYWHREHLPSKMTRLYLEREMDADNYAFRADTEPNRRFREENKFYPAYDLGYLLRHLGGDAEIWVGWIKTGFYLAKAGYEFRFKRATADTPEDAVTKLAIELFKQGILLKESK